MVNLPVFSSNSDSDDSNTFGSALLRPSDPPRRCSKSPCGHPSQSMTSPSRSPNSYNKRATHPLRPRAQSAKHVLFPNIFARPTPSFSTAPNLFSSRSAFPHRLSACPISQAPTLESPTAHRPHPRPQSALSAQRVLAWMRRRDGGLPLWRCFSPGPRMLFLAQPRISSRVRMTKDGGDDGAGCVLQRTQGVRWTAAGV